MKKEVWDRKCHISPSLITFDLCNLERAAKQIGDSGLTMVHVDILDGHFSPSMPLGLDAVKQLRSRTGLEFEAHVMATEPQFFVDELLDAGVSQICFHIETAPHADGMLNYIHSRGVRAGVALKPSTPLNVLDYILEKCDSVLLMLINPGYAQMAGEGQVPYGARKIRELHQMIAERGLSTKVELDGRVSEQNILEFGREGSAQIFAAGSTCISKADIEGSLAHLKEVEDSLQG
ncbi:MAG: ribulose-phosphate 3-epimerase [Lachnospiraceae bacterium]|nr:ribulose-phosphate 3-epimerase [Lachnospiraceae bacterium]